ncbi:hypothetical protein PGB90_009228 [Kerria lacca]
MQFPHLCTKKWFQIIVFFVIIYAFIKTLFSEHEETKFDSRFASLEHFKLWSKYHNINSKIDVLDVLPNCGIPYTCPDNTFPVHIYTGHKNKDPSKLCIMGKYITNHASNDGRGLNIAVINTKRLKIKTFVTFDVYIDSSIVVDMWMNNTIKSNDIVLIYTFDEASRMLVESSKKLFYDYVIPVEVSPPVIPNIKVTAKEIFCNKHEKLRYGYFCNGMRKYDDILPAPLTNRNIMGNVIFSTPIAIIVTEIDKNTEHIDSLTMTLESLIRQPGIDPANVYVFYNGSNNLIVELVNIFKFHLVSLNIKKEFDDNTCSVGYKITEAAMKMLGRKERYVIIINSGLILSPDFLYFMSQLVIIADIDRSIIGISAWNVNGYKTVSSNVNIVYRVRDFPSIGFLVRSDICTKYCEVNIAHSCLNVSSMSVLLNKKIHPEVHILVPDISRVLWRPLSELNEKYKNEYRRQIIVAERNTNTLPSVVLQDPNLLINASYYQHVSDLLRNSLVISFSHDEIKKCESGDSFPMKLMSKFQNKTFSLYYDEEDDQYEISLKNIVNCFGIYVDRNYNLGGSYYGVFRLTFNTNNVLLVKSGSPFHIIKPNNWNNV